MSNSALWTKVKTYAADAPVAGFVNTNFGRLEVTPIVVVWKEVNGVRSPVKHVLKEGEEVADRETLELKIVVKISELNPQLTFDYERTVQIKNNGSQKTDWAEIVQPSLEKVFGKNVWADALDTNPYVAVEDVNNIAGRASTAGKVYGVPKFTAKFADKAACEAARDLRYHKKDVPATGEAVAEDEEASTSPTPEAIKQAKSLIASVGEKKARKMLDAKPFGNYDTDVLVALAMNDDE